MLVLPIEKKWFDMIVSGEKKEEYREIKPYYCSRLEKLLSKQILNEHRFKAFEVIFRNGYSCNSPSAKCLCTVHKGYGKEKWGAIPDKEYYILRVLKIIEINNV